MLLGGSYFRFPATEPVQQNSHGRMFCAQPRVFPPVVSVSFEKASVAEVNPVIQLRQCERCLHDAAARSDW